MLCNGNTITCTYIIDIFDIHISMKLLLYMFALNNMQMFNAKPTLYAMFEVYACALSYINFKNHLALECHHTNTDVYHS